METFNAKSVLDRFKSSIGISNNAELSKYLNVEPSTISNWIKRNSLNFPLIFTKCESINIDWLITGRKFSIDKENDIQDMESIISSISDKLLAKIEEQARTIGRLEAQIEYLQKKNKNQEGAGDAVCGAAGM